MQIKAFRVRKYRNIDDSGIVRLYDGLTCVVGKNQSGKSALLRALHKFNPYRDEPYDMRREWPRGQRTTRSAEQVVCEVHFELSDQEAAVLISFANTQPVSSRQMVIVTKTYAGDYGFRFPDLQLFRNLLCPSVLESICQELPKPNESAGEEFVRIALECVTEVERYIKEGRFEELKELEDRHKERMKESHDEERSVSRAETQGSFISVYSSHLVGLSNDLVEERERYSGACQFIRALIPRFIYMDDYKTFRGRSVLDRLQSRLEEPSEGLSEEEETFMMILKLAGLDLGELIEQGNSSDQHEKHDRQLDLQDAAKTLTREVAGRWGQNEYEIQFRVDGQIFFTGIEEINRDIGMIPLEEQSKGFQWFFSFDMHFMHDSDGTFENCVLLLDPN
ncbi:MAG: AAA family ATPase [Spirochaetaceae bacterium]|nr:AAA family ATPase [Spirochaetaceae bacterium]